ncbi:MAG TPA: flavodoxin [Candidatus Bathyarchaeota archaeon]|mgnify:CR=1 FL=1|nr:flavodoxin [Candidatus Bathyarchaeota archaeon]
MSSFLIICKSIHLGNTLKIANEMAKILECKVLEPEKVEAEDIEEAEVIGLGSGIYYGRHHTSIFKLLDKYSFKGKRVFVFYTSAFRKVKFLNGCEDKLLNKLRKHGAEIIGVFQCRGESRLLGGVCKGRPDERDLARAREFAEKLKKKFS